MISKRLEAILADVGPRGEAEMVQRFQTLRDYKVLPKSRGKNAEDLSLPEIAAGILSVVSERASYAGTSTKKLRALLPVGGEGASFAKAPSLGTALAAIFASEETLDLIREVRITDSEIYMNSSGRASITYRSGRGDAVAWYVRKEAVSRLQSGAEREFDPRDTLRPSMIETVLYKEVFRAIFKELKRERAYALERAPTDAP